MFPFGPRARVVGNNSSLAGTPAARHYAAEQRRRLRDGTGTAAHAQSQSPSSPHSSVHDAYGDAILWVKTPINVCHCDRG